VCSLIPAPLFEKTHSACLLQPLLSASVRDLTIPAIPSTTKRTLYRDHTSNCSPTLFLLPKMPSLSNPFRSSRKHFYDRNIVNNRWIIELLARDSLDFYRVGNNVGCSSRPGSIPVPAPFKRIGFAICSTSHLSCVSPQFGSHDHCSKLHLEGQ